MKTDKKETITLTIPRLKSDHMKAKEYIPDTPAARQRLHENVCIAQAIRRGAQEVAESLRGERRNRIVKLIAEQVTLQNRLLDLKDEISRELALATAATPL